MLASHRARALSSIVGIGVAFFLAAAQLGLLVGWSRTTSAIIRHSGADVWVMARQTPAFDYGTAIGRSRVYQVRSVAGVQWAEGLFMAWNIWQRPDGRRVNIELVGLDNGNAGGPWKMRSGDVDAVHRPDNVLVDELYADALGVRNAGEMVEILGTRAIVGGLTRDVRTFTASPFVFTSIASAIKYDKRYSPDEVTYVLARCAPNTLATTVKNNVAQALPDVDVLTTPEFAFKTVRYWMLETGVGITVVLTAALGICIGAIITTQTVFSITHDHLHDYTTLLAIGFMHRALRTVVFHQSILLGAAGIFIGTIIFIPASIMSMRTSIPIETTPAVFAGLAFLYLTICVGASFVSVREIYKIDPVAVFTR